MMTGLKSLTLEPFFAENPCPHCLRIGASYKLHTSACEQIGVEGEHIHRQCASCGHEWAEAPRPLRIVGYGDTEISL
jgi:hypothetical protein